jgi:valyl-tRNA synthetase
MQARYDAWINGLNSDWLISRQRFFGVPIPVWYRLDAQGHTLYDEILVPEESALPIDPSTDVPPGCSEADRGRPGGFVGETDIMDTWATSSLTPQIACGWEDDPDLFDRTFPMDLRPQGPEIIRTWLFSSVVRSHLEHGTVPWANTTLNGWILDPDRKKMSKSKGNVVTPHEVLDRHGSDAVRYWACSARPGTDTALDEGQMKVGRRLAIKILNASKFALGLGGEDAEPVGGPEAVTEVIDRAMIAQLQDLVSETTRAFEGFDYARALERTEAFFWTFCDDYLELVKGRAYGAAGEAPAASARAALGLALSTLLRQFAPFLPYATEEVWSWWQDGSVHGAPWPTADELSPAAEARPLVVQAAAAALGEIRKAKTEAKRSLRTQVTLVTITGSTEWIDALRLAEADLREVGNVVQLDLVVDDAVSGLVVEVTLAPE